MMFLTGSELCVSMFIFISLSMSTFGNTLFECAIVTRNLL